MFRLRRCRAPHRLKPTGWRGQARLSALGLLTVVALCGAVAAQPSETAAQIEDGRAPSTAWVVIDGRSLFPVRGITSFPAAQRAAVIAERIKAFAADAALPTSSLRTEEGEFGTRIVGGDVRLMTVLEEDARVEGIDPRLLAQAYLATVAQAVTEYRNDRTGSRLTRDALLTLAATVVAAVAAFLVARLMRALNTLILRRYQLRIERIESGSYRLIRARTIWDMAHAIVMALGLLLTVTGVYLYLQYVLSLYPWTRGIAHRLPQYLLDPFAGVATGILVAIPDLVVVAIVVVAARYLLAWARRFFGAVGQGEIKLANFDPEWADPTLRILRFAIVAFAAVVAYPYIPGSDSAAFKGVTIFMGVLFSLGSSSLMANMLAGYTMTYRRAFRVGDRIQIGDVIGDVTQIRLMVTHLRSLKNEEVIVPNAKILAGEVTNFSSLARDRGLILHTTVGIGYETPWRQVEAMLLMAADRTAGILREPPPFILQKGLGDFCVTYELNVYSDRPLEMGPLYTALHRSILDVFNEYGVQIMTPAYESDPSEPKVVPKENWFAAPARAEGNSSSAQKVGAIP